MKTLRLCAAACLLLLATPMSLLAQAKGVAEETSKNAPVGTTHVYKTVDGHDVHVYVASPDAAKFPGARPILVTIHGGGFTGGTPSSLNPQAEYFQKRGMASVEVEYRLIGKGATVLEDQVRDVRAAVRWAKAHAGEFHGDSKRVVIMGGSAGGYLTEANILLAGPDDAADDKSISTMPVAAVLFNPALNGAPGSPMAKIVGERWKDLSPLARVSKDQPPTIMLHGANDTTVGVPDILEFQKRVAAAGVRCELNLYPGQAHGFFNREPYTTATLIPIDAFLTSLGLLAPSTPPANPLAADKLPVVTR